MKGLTVFGVEDCSLIAVILVVLLTFVFTRGISESKIFNTIFTTLKLATLVLIVIIGLSEFKISRFEPFVLEEQGGLKGTLRGAAVLFLGFNGFDFITVLYPDAKRPA